MSYSSIAEVRLAVAPGITNPSQQPSLPDGATNTAADLPDSQLQDAIDEADSTIDSYIAGRYVTPAVGVNAQAGSPTPHPIDFWSRNIAAYLATLTYRGSQDFSDQDPIARRYSATMTALGNVSAGRAELPSLTTMSTGAPGEGSGAGVAYNAYEGSMFALEDFNLVPSNQVRPRWYW